MRAPSARPFWSLKSPGLLNFPKLKLKVPLFVKAARAHLMVCAAALVIAAILHLALLFYLICGGAVYDVALRVMMAAGMWTRGGRIAEWKRRRHQGMASRREIRRLMSPAAMQKKVQLTRPATNVKRMAPTEVGAHIGKSAGRMTHQKLMGSWEDFYLVFAGPRMGKTGWFSDVVLNVPGAVVSTSTRADVLAHTIMTRQELGGPVYVLNPTNDAGISSTLFWNPVTGCDNPATAIERAGYMMAAAPKDSSGKDAWWDHQGGEALRLAFHAAALKDRDMMQVKSWIADLTDPELLDILEHDPGAAYGWADELRKMITRADDDAEYMNGVSRAAGTALSWLADPEMERVACPLPDEEFNPEQFILAGGTMYLIGAHRPHSSLTPYFSCLIMDIWNTAKQVAAASLGLRLDPPLAMVIDEPALCFRGPLDQMSAEAGGHGITVVTGVQSPAQLIQVWGENGGKIIRDNASIKLYFGGMTDAAELKALSDLCGSVDSWHYVHTPEGKIKQPTQIPLLSIARLRTLAAGQAVMLHRSGRPVITQVAAVWKRKGYEPANLADYVWATDEETEMVSLEKEVSERIG